MALGGRDAGMPACILAWKEERAVDMKIKLSAKVSNLPAREGRKDLKLKLHEI